MAPVLTAAAGLAVLALLWNDQILPRANHRLRILLVEIQHGQPATTPDTVKGDREMSIGEMRVVARSAREAADSALARGREADAEAARRRAAVYVN